MKRIRLRIRQGEAPPYSYKIAIPNWEELEQKDFIAITPMISARKTLARQIGVIGHFSSSKAVAALELMIKTAEKSEDEDLAMKTLGELEAIAKLSDHFWKPLPIDKALVCPIKTVKIGRKRFFAPRKDMLDISLGEWAIMSQILADAQPDYSLFISIFYRPKGDKRAKNEIHRHREAFDLSKCENRSKIKWPKEALFAALKYMEAAGKLIPMLFPKIFQENGQSTSWRKLEYTITKTAVFGNDIQDVRRNSALLDVLTFLEEEQDND